MIKKIATLSCLLAFIGFTASSHAAYIEDEGFYIGFTGNVGFPSSLNSNNVYGTFGFFDNLVVSGPLKNSTVGGGGGAQLGYRYGPLRLEGQFLWIHNHTKSAELSHAIFPFPSFDNFETGGFSNVYAGMANVFYDFFYFGDQTREIVTVPYVGGGVGYAGLQQRINVNFNSDFFDNPSWRFTPSDSGLAYQFIVGSSFFLDSYTSLTLDYRYFAISNLNTFNSSYNYHSINLGINFLLDFDK